MTRALVALLVAAAGAAHADTPRQTPAAMDVDRGDAPPGRAEFGFDGGAPVEAWGASVAFGWLEQPIAAGDTHPVARRETLALGGALALGSSVVIDARIAAAHQIGDRLAAFGDSAPLARAVFEDVRLGARLRVVGDSTRAAFLRAELTLPTGNDAQFAGEARWTAAWSLIGRATLGPGIVVAAQAGIRLRGAEVQIGDRVVGDELFGALGVAVPVCSCAAVTAEVLGIAGDNVAKRRGPSPAEARLGVVRRVGPVSVALRAGLGLDDQIGAPRLRADVELAWTPRSDPP